MLSSPLKQKNQIDLPEKLLPSFDTISKQILKTKATLLPSEDCSSSLATESSDSTILPPIKESHLMPSSSSCSIVHDAPASATFDLSSARTPKDILASLLSPSDTSMFQVLYNLEVRRLSKFRMCDVTLHSWIWFPTVKRHTYWCCVFIHFDILEN